MATPYLAQISITGFNFAPRGWATCDGQLLPINQNQALFALLGTQFGGNGVQTFSLPDLRGRSAIHRSATLPVGQSVGAETVTLTAGQLPAHTHTLKASSDFANAAVPGNALPAARPRGGLVMYAAPDGGSAVAMNPASVTATGGGQPHDNMQPFTVLNFVIALTGIFPSRN
jgi:microcystin-dependent protein